MNTDRWFRCPSPLEAHTERLYCFPFAGGGPMAFRAWPAHFPATEVWAVHLPGRESRMGEPPFTDMDALMDVLVPLFAAHADAPFSLFGHSMGAMVAFELTRRLEADTGLRPNRLFVSGHAAPSSPAKPNHSHTLPHAEFVDRIRSFEGTPDEVFEHKELLEIFVPLLRADITLLETYKCIADARVACPIVALGGRDDKEVAIAALDDWAAHTHAAFEVHAFDGGHFYWNDAPEPMLRVINATLRGPS